MTGQAARSTGARPPQPPIICGPWLNLGDPIPAPSTRNWRANELPDFAGGHYHVEVTGEVQASATNYMPKLTYRNPQGINPRILMLDLTIEKTAEFGGQVVMFRKADYSRPPPATNTTRPTSCLKAKSSNASRSAIPRPS